MMILKPKSSRGKRDVARGPSLRFREISLLHRTEKVRSTLVDNHRYAKTTMENKKVREIVARLAIRQIRESRMSEAVLRIRACFRHVRRAKYMWNIAIFCPRGSRKSSYPVLIVRHAYVSRMPGSDVNFRLLGSSESAGS